MKIIINQNERGLLFKHGMYQKLLEPGVNKVRPLFGESFVRLPINKAIAVPHADMEVLMLDKAFAQHVIKIDVPDGHIAVRYEDGRIASTFTAGKYFYFNIYQNITYKLFDISTIEIADLTPEQINRLPKELYSKAVVGEGETGLLFLDGKFTKSLSAGAYYFWNTKTNAVVEKVDLRSQELEINGQEILTSDKVSLRVNFVCTYRITDAVKLISGVKNYKERLYTVTQLALREYIGKFRFDELLEQKDTIAAVVLENLKTHKDNFCVEFTGAGLKDIILPGEIRAIMNTVLIAEKNAQANVIARREEVASTRSLLNTAKLLDENATLYKLKELEYLEKICVHVGSISVGGGNLLSELQKIVTAPR
ncbi:MAG: slipin family protein [Firmicutes bacterium]|nr:slipin family protein [Bacillota bacterium]